MYPWFDPGSSTKTEPGIWREPGVFDRRYGIIDALDEERRCRHRRQDIPDIDLRFGHEERDGVARAGGAAQPGRVLSKPLGVVADVRPYILPLFLGERQRSPTAFNCIDVLIPCLLAPGPRILRVPLAESRGCARHEGGDAIRVSRGEHCTQCESLFERHEGRPFGSGVIHHRSDVVHHGLEREVRFAGNDVVREPRPSSIEQDQSGEPGEPHGEPRHLGPLPYLLDVEDEPGHEDEVARTLAQDLVGDVDPVGGLRVAGPRHVHIWHPSYGPLAAATEQNAGTPVQTRFLGAPFRAESVLLRRCPTPRLDTGASGPERLSVHAPLGPRR
jgi:hypothetical protein